MSIKRYDNGTIAVARPWHGYDLPEVKLRSMRDDFNDMFAAECRYRQKRGDLSVVFVLTYNSDHLTVKYGRNLLNSLDLKCFAKSSAFCKRLLAKLGYTFDYICVGEYGSGGASHGVTGKRTVGNNPHYHCVGWFSLLDSDLWLSDHTDYYKSIGLFDYAKDHCVDITDPSQVLPLLVRYEWQKSFEDNIVVYSSCYSPYSMGYVCLQGSIKGNRASTYISKYMGKDVRSKYLELYRAGFVPHFLDIIADKLKESYGDDINWSDFNVVRAVAFWWLRNSSVTDSTSEFSSCIPICSTFNPLSSCPDVDKFYKQVDILFTIYEEEFNADMNTVHSPKVRKFHGFGYNLFEGDETVEVDKNKGTYTVTTKTGPVTRSLPPSIIRHFYYNHHIYNVPLGDKIVKYVPNHLGIQLLVNRAKSQFNDVFHLCKNDDRLKDYALPLSVFHTYLSKLCISVAFFCDGDFDTLLHDVSIAESFLVDMTPVEFPESLRVADGIYIDLVDLLRERYPDLYTLYLYLLDRLRQQYDALEANTKEFNDSWFNFYISSY